MLGGNCDTLTARPNEPSKVLLSRIMKEPAGLSFKSAIATTHGIFKINFTL